LDRTMRCAGSSNRGAGARARPPGFSPEASRVTIITRPFDLGTGIAKAPVVDVHDDDNTVPFRPAAALRPVLARVR
jgi:hypothetical protein